MRASVLLTFALPLAVLGASGPALASATFPEVVASKIPSLGCVPQCTLCHQTNPGMIPAAKPFALSLKGVSPIAPLQTEMLATALDKLKVATPPPDTDADGVGDYAELAAGTDPNLADPAATLCGVAPTYGCGATIAAKPQTKSGADTTATLASAFTLLAGLFLLRRRRP